MRKNSSVEKPSITIVGDDSLIGREVKQVLSERAPDLLVHALGEESETAIVRGLDGTPVMVGAVLEGSNLASAEVLILAGTPDSARRVRDALENEPRTPALIDLTEPPDTRIVSSVRAPLVERPTVDAPGAESYRIAHPGAIVLAGFLERLQPRLGVQRILADIFEPASQYGKAGIAELQHQTTNLLNFKSLPKEVFGAQLSFNLLPALGPEALVDLATVERRIGDEVSKLTAGSSQPSLRLIQAPVFHGLSLSVWVELSQETGVPELIKALASNHVEVRSGDEEPPTNAGITGQSGISIGRITPDRHNPRAFWCWIVADNHRVVAENSVALARLLVPVEGRA